MARDCKQEVGTIFDAFQRVNALRMSIRSRMSIDAAVQNCIGRVNQDCIFEMLHQKIMSAWTAREITKRKLYVGFLRTDDTTTKVSPFVPLSACIVDPESYYQKSQMYQWITDNSGALLTYLKKSSPALSWKWETRGVNKLIVRIKPT